MKNKFIIILCLVQQVLLAQKVGFTGYGRAQILNSKLSGKVLKNDTLSPNKSTDGDMIFDVGMHFQPYDYFRAKALIRLNNQFGVFFGQGAAVEFRQILIEGLVSKKVKYSLGDIDIQYSPYTVFNNSDTSFFEPEVFKIRRNITHYENFNFGNNWRVQGAKANALFQINNSNTFLDLEGFASRTKPTNYNSTPDRFLTGLVGKLYADQKFLAKAHLVDFFEMPKQIDSTSYRNLVTSLELNYQVMKEKIGYGIANEIGASAFKKTYSSDSSRKLNATFVDAKIWGGYNPLKSKLTVGYSYVGTHFTSPAAQSLRLFAQNSNEIFTQINNNQTTRNQLWFDRLSDPSLYNKSITTGLMAYLPQYGNVLPYGDATPNRTGFKTKLEIGEKSSPVQVKVQFMKLAEIQADSAAEKRKFMYVNLGLAYAIHKILKWQKQLVVFGNIRNEHTSREGSDSVNLKSSQLDVGLSAEIFKNLDLLLAYKMVSAKGNEYVHTLNTEYKTNSTTYYDAQMKQSYLSVGFKYRFTEQSFLNLTSNFMVYNDQQNSSLSYNMAQHFITYVLQF